jgi:hypothetical protein
VYIETQKAVFLVKYSSNGYLIRKVASKPNDDTLVPVNATFKGDTVVFYRDGSVSLFDGETVVFMITDVVYYSVL